MKCTSLLFVVALLLIVSSCEDSENPIDTVLQDTERGAILRTISVDEGIFNPNDLSSGLQVLLEEQDIEEGIIFDGVDVFVSYLDRSPDVGTSSLSEKLLKTVGGETFTPGPVNLPRSVLTVTLEEVLSSFNLTEDDISCPDQVAIRLELKLDDGRTFSINDAAASILTEDCFFKSPYYYLVPITEPVAESLFTGTYFFETLEDDASFPVLGNSGVVDIALGEFENERIIPFGIEGTPFVITCNTAYLKSYESLNGPCENSAANVLLGPSTETGALDSSDDGVFELEFVYGFRGFTGFSGPERNVRIRFSKQ